MAAPKLPKRLSLADVESSSERVVPGTYHAKVAAMEPKLNKAGDGYYFNVDLVIISEGSAKNRHVWEILPLKANALWKLKGFLVSCGVDADEDVETEEIPELCIGQVVDVVIGEEDYQGETRSVVRRVKPSTMPTLDDLAEDEDDVEDEEEDEDEEAEEGEYDRDELSEMPIKDLRQLAKDEEVYEKGMTKEDLLDALCGAEEESDEDEEDEDEDPFAEDEDEEEPEPAPRKKRATRK